MLLGLLLLPHLHLGVYLGARLDGLPGLLLGGVQRLGERGEGVAHLDVVQAAAVQRRTLVERDGVALGVLPARDAGRHLPVVVVLLRRWPRRRAQHWHRRRPGGGGHSLVLELGRLERVLLGLPHPDDPLRRAGVERRCLPRRRVLDEFRVVVAGQGVRRLHGGEAFLDDRTQRGARPRRGLLHGRLLVIVGVGGGGVDLGQDVAGAGVHGLPGVLPLSHDGVELDAAAAPIDGEAEHAAGRPPLLPVAVAAAAAHVEQVLRDVDLGKAPPSPKSSFLRGASADRLRRAARIHRPRRPRRVPSAAAAAVPLLEPLVLGVVVRRRAPPQPPPCEGSGSRRTITNHEANQSTTTGDALWVMDVRGPPRPRRLVGDRDADSVTDSSSEFFVALDPLAPGIFYL